MRHFKRFFATFAALTVLGCQPNGIFPFVGNTNKDPVPVSSQDGGLVSNNSGSLISNNSANLVGVITGPSQLISNNAGGLISNNAGGYRIAAIETSPVAHAVVYLTTPNEQFYAGSDGKALYTFTDDKGAYDFKVAPAEVPVVVTVLLPANRRLVGFLVPKKGETNTYDVDLATTVVTEFLRDQARLAHRSMADYPDLATKLPTIIGLTRDLIASGQMHFKESETDTRAGYVDLNVNSIPAMRHEYVRAFAASNQALSDAWKDLLGYRPLLVDEVEVGLGAGMQPIAVTTDGGTTYTAAINAYQLVVTKTTGGTSQNLLALPRTQSFLDYVGGMTASGSHLFLGVAGIGEVEIDTTQPESSDLYYSADTGGGGVGFVQGNGGYETVPGDPDSWEYFSAFDVAVHGSWLYVTSDIDHRLLRYHLDADGNAIDVQPVAGAALSDSSAAYYDGKSRNFFNGDAWQTGSAVAFNYPTSVTVHSVDGKDYLYFADTDNHRIRRMELNDTTFPVETVLGRGTTAYGNIMQPEPDAWIDDPLGEDVASASLNFPHKVVFDASGRMFVADSDNRRIRMVADGVVRTVAGTGAGVASGVGDSRRIGLGEVSSIAFDQDGNLLIADARSPKLRRLRVPFGF